MGRSPIALLALIGTTAGGFVPELWGGGDFSVTGLLFSAAGGLAGVWLGVRLVDL